VSQFCVNTLLPSEVRHLPPPSAGVKMAGAVTRPVLYESITRARAIVGLYNKLCFGNWVWCQRPDADTIPRGLNHCRNCTCYSEDGLKESPKHVRQK
jgi:hypothetical protein